MTAVLGNVRSSRYNYLIIKKDLNNIPLLDMH